MTQTTALTPAAIGAELSEIAAELARRTLLRFTAYTWPGYDINFHHQVVASALDRVLAGACRRLMVFMPPQNGKSELVSRRFPAFAFGRNPDLRIVATSYNATLAETMSRDVQKIMASDAYHVLFPRTRLAGGSDIEKKTYEEFEVVGKRGAYVSAGVDGGIGGKTANIGIIDDPVKNREEAESETYRERVWNWYTSTFLARQFGNTGSIVLCTTRWHEDDLAGRLLRLAAENPQAEQWEVLSFPALAEVSDAYRRVGEALWPTKYPLDELERRRAVMGEYDWSSLYQQRPAPSGGGLFKREWFKVVEKVPTQARRVRGWDTAGTEGGGDWTVGVKIAEHNGLFFVEDVVRGQWGPHSVDAIMLQTTKLDGLACAQREEREGGSAGKAVIAARARTLVGYDYQEVPITGDKVVRAKPFRAQCAAGNVMLVAGPWNEKYLAELCTFPTGQHDDQVDGSSCAFNAVIGEPARDGSLVW